MFGLLCQRIRFMLFIKPELDEVYLGKFNTKLQSKTNSEKKKSKKTKRGGDIQVVHEKKLLTFCILLKLLSSATQSLVIDQEAGCGVGCEGVCSNCKEWRALEREAT